MPTIRKLCLDNLKAQLEALNLFNLGVETNVQDWIDLDMTKPGSALLASDEGHPPPSRLTGCKIYRLEVLMIFMTNRPAPESVLDDLYAAVLQMLESDHTLPAPGGAQGTGPAREIEEQDLSDQTDLVEESVEGMIRGMGIEIVFQTAENDPTQPG